MSDTNSGIGDDPGGVGERADFDPNALDGIGTAEPAAVSGGRRRRSDAGTPRGPRDGTAASPRGTARAKKEVSSLDLTSLTGMFVGIHAMLASLSGHDELAITEDEGTAFMRAAANCMRHYNVKSSQKVVDHTAFVGCVVAMYGPRMFILREKIKDRRSAPQARGTGSNTPPFNVLHPEQPNIMPNAEP